MNLEQAIGAVQADLEELERQLRRPRDLAHFHSARAARSTYQAVLVLLEPLKDMVGPEVRLQRAYLKGVAEACQKAARLLRDC